MILLHVQRICRDRNPDAAQIVGIFETRQHTRENSLHQLQRLGFAVNSRMSGNSNTRQAMSLRASSAM